MTESYILNATAGKNIIFSFLFYTNCTLRFDKTKCFCFFLKGLSPQQSISSYLTVSI